ncbi:Uncharacterised protein [Mycobacteroides abscessus subsp. abscessus]|nr:Uncharacterised protein [Mycobacteroides abscessus subsp. abscessus]SLC12226.1 Uncharacterised protein [Mycobacteroides abscessus subsp. massiliense]
MMTNIKIIVNVQKKICIDNIKSPNREQIQIVQHKVKMIESMKIILNVITMEETIDVSSNWKKKMKNQAKLKNG